MNLKKTVLYAVLLVLVITGASFLYDYLSENYESDSISVIEGQGETVENETYAENKTDDSQSSDESGNTNSGLAPDFTVVDADGNEVKLSDKFGKPVIVNFWASWCPPCKMEMPDFEEAYKKYGDDVHFMMVNMTGGRETVESAKAFVSGEGYTFPVYFDTQDDAAMTYGASSIPMTFFIDKDGSLAAYARGMIYKESLEEGIKMIYNVSGQAEQ